MRYHGNRLFVLSTSLLVLAITVSPSVGATYSWIGGTSDVNTPANWGGSPTTGDTINFLTTGSLTPTQSNTFNSRFMVFQSGANAYTWDANGSNLFIGSGSSSTTRGAITNNSSSTQTINITGGGTFAMTGDVNGTGTGATVLNGSINPGNNTNSTGAFLNFVNTGPVYVNADTSALTGGTITTGNVNATAWAATSGGNRGRTYFEGTGNVYLGNIGTAYRGYWNLDGSGDQNVILTHNNSLGSSAVNGSRVYITGGVTGNDTLQVQGGISTATYLFFLDARTASSDPHIQNLSGNNTITITGDFNSNNTASGNWNFRSDAGKLTLATGNIYNTSSGTINMNLQGAGDGQITGSLVVWNSTPALSVVKTDAGKWTLSDIPAGGVGSVTAIGSAVSDTPNTSTSRFTGTFAVNQGTLEFKPLATGAKITLAPTSTISVADGAKLAISQFDSTSTAVNSSSSLALGASTGASIDFNLAGVPTAAPLIVNSFTTAGINVVNVTSGAPLSVGQFTLLDYSGSIGGAGFASLSIGALPPRVMGSLVDNAGNTSVDLNVTAIDTIKWKGNVNAIWDINTTSNWVLASDGVTSTTYLQPTAPGDSVTFDDTAAGNFNVNVSTNVSPASVTFNNSSNNYTLSGTGNLTAGAVTKTGSGIATFATSGTLSMASLAINGGTVEFNRAADVSLTGTLSGSGSIAKNNTNTLTLGMAAAGYSGNIDVNTGTLKAGASNAIGTGTTTVASGATFDVNGQLISTGTVKLIGTGVGGNGALTTSGGAPGLVQNITLTGNTTFTTNLASGYNIGANFGSGVSGSGVFQGNGFDLTAILKHEIDIKNVGDMNIKNLNIDGSTTTAENVLYLAGDTSLTAASGGAINLLDRGRLGFYGTGGTQGQDSHTGLVDKPIVVANTANGGQLEIYRGNQVIASSIALNGKLSVDIGMGESATFTTSLSGPLSGTGELAVHTSASNNLRYGVVALTNDNNSGHSGQYTVGGGGGMFNGGITAATDRVSLSIGDGGSTGSAGTGEIIVTSVATANASDAISGSATTIANGKSASQLILNRTGSYTLTNNVTLQGGTGGGANVSRVKSLLGDATLSGIISGPGKVNVINPTGSLTLAGNNTYTGYTEITKGRLILAHNNALGAVGTNNAGYLQIYGPSNAAAVGADDSPAVLLTNNITVQKAATYVSLHSTNAANAGQILSTGNNTIIGTIATDSIPDATNRFLTLQSNSNSNLKIDGNIRQDHAGAAVLTLRGAGNGEVTGQIFEPTTHFYDNSAVSGNTWELVKEGSGTWKLSGTSVITGSTTINNGKLAVNGTLTSGPVTVNGGQLGGTGTVNAAVNILGGTLSPGNSIGTLTIGGNLTLTSGSVDWEFSGGGGSPAQNAAVLGADVTNVQALSIAAGVSLVGTNLGTIPVAWNTRLTVLGYTSGAPGTFAGMADDTLVSFGGQTWLINYDDGAAGINGGVGNKFVTLTAVPEASSMLVMGLGSLFALGAVWLGKRFGLVQGRS